jgi:hypothetical protein
MGEGRANTAAVEVRDLVLLAAGEDDTAAAICMIAQKASRPRGLIKPICSNSSKV